MDTRMSMLMIEDDEPAVLAILLFLANNIGYFSPEYIDKHVFYGMADENALKNILDAMCAVGLVGTIGGGVFELASNGKTWVREQMARVTAERGAMAKIDDFIALLKSETIEEWGMHWDITTTDNELYDVLQVDDGRLYIHRDDNEPSMELHALRILEAIGEVIPDIIAMYERASERSAADQGREGEAE